MKLTSRGIILAFSTLASGCADAPTTSANPELRRELDQLGFAGSDVREAIDRFVVEGDIIILKKHLRLPAHNAIRQSGSTRLLGDTLHRPNSQWLNGGGQVGTGTAQSIPINLSGLGTNDAGWKIATRDAMLAWSSLTGGLAFTEGSSTGYIQVYSTSNPAVDCLEASAIACASYPHSFGPGSSIYVNRAFDYYTNSQKTLVMVHELGHTIGLRHSNWQGYESSNGATLIGGTPSTDGSSVMNRAVGGLSWSGFSYYDVVAISTLYPTPPVPVSITYSPTNSRISYGCRAPVGNDV